MMIVCVETNFVLELALRQERSAACQKIVDFAALKQIRLVLPSCSVVEAYKVVAEDKKKRVDLMLDVTKQASKVRQSKPYVDVWRSSEDFVGFLGRSTVDETVWLDDALYNIISVAEQVPSSPEAIRGASESVRVKYSLDKMDALVFFSVIAYLEFEKEGPRMFLNANKRDFKGGIIEKQLKDRDCDLVTDFKEGLEKIEQHLTDQR